MRQSHLSWSHFTEIAKTVEQKTLRRIHKFDSSMIDQLSSGWTRSETSEKTTLSYRTVKKPCTTFLAFKIGLVDISWKQNHISFFQVPTNGRCSQLTMTKVAGGLRCERQSITCMHGFKLWVPLEQKGIDGDKSAFFRALGSYIM